MQTQAVVEEKSQLSNELIGAHPLGKVSKDLDHTVAA